MAGRRQDMGQDTRQDGMPIVEAAARLGVTTEGVRKRLQRGTLTGYKRDGHWYLLLDETRPAASGRPAGQWQAARQDDDQTGPAEPIEASYRVDSDTPPTLVPLKEALAQVAPLAEQLAALATRNETLALEVGQLRERTGQHEARLTEQQETIAELRRRAEVAEAQVQQLTARQNAVDVSRGQSPEEAAPAAPGAPAPREPSTDAPVPAGGLWQRFRAALLGQ